MYDNNGSKSNQDLDHSHWKKKEKKKEKQNKLVQSSYALWMSFWEIKLIKSIFKILTLWITIYYGSLSYPQCQP